MAQELRSSNQACCKLYVQSLVMKRMFQIRHSIIWVAVGVLVILCTALGFVLHEKRVQFAAILEAENVYYEDYNSRLQKAAEKLVEGLSRDQVEKIMILPPDDYFFDNTSTRVTWHWNAGSQRGVAHKTLGYAGSKGYFTVSVIFNNRGEVEKIYSGIN